MLVAQCRVPHVSKLDVALGAGVHEEVAMHWVEFGGGNDFGQFFHIYWLDVHNICAE